jgi:hypothetical protein
LGGTVKGREIDAWGESFDACDVRTIIFKGLIAVDQHAKLARSEVELRKRLHHVERDVVVSF